MNFLERILGIHIHKYCEETGMEFNWVMGRLKRFPPDFILSHTVYGYNSTKASIEVEDV